MESILISDDEDPGVICRICMSTINSKDKFYEVNSENVGFENNTPKLLNEKCLPDLVSYVPKVLKYIWILIPILILGNVLYTKTHFYFKII